MANHKRKGEGGGGGQKARARCEWHETTGGGGGGQGEERGCMASRLISWRLHGTIWQGGGRVERGEAISHINHTCQGRFVLAMKFSNITVIT